ncbi:hypothetical protein NQ314_017451, partial [Rhamnusium bicolor]
TYDWGDRNVILSSFYWCNIVAQIIGGKLAAMFGTKLILSITIVINSVASLLLPLSAQYLGSTGVIICRLTQGLSVGLINTSSYHILGIWAPAPERSRILSMMYTGHVLSSIFTNVMTGYICSSRVGWPFTFYLSGCLGVVWILPWIMFASDSPAKHKTISVQEKMYIQALIGGWEEPQVIKLLFKCLLKLSVQSS